MSAGGAQLRLEDPLRKCSLTWWVGAGRVLPIEVSSQGDLGFLMSWWLHSKSQCPKRQTVEIASFLRLGLENYISLLPYLLFKQWQSPRSSDSREGNPPPTTTTWWEEYQNYRAYILKQLCWGLSKGEGSHQWANAWNLTSLSYPKWD